ncbi:MAG: flagellar motor switch protein FliN [Desulfobacterales bacterium]|nr:flagellar motor switch protein FliN [Desulfobacterales bacterium]
MGTQTDDPAQPAPATGESISDEAPASAGSPTGEAPASEAGNSAAGGTKVPAAEDLGLEILLDIPMELTVELGRTKIPIRELLKLSPGSAVKLAKFEGDPVDILANDVLIARGEVVVRNEKYGIRITEITSRMERLKGLR